MRAPYLSIVLAGLAAAGCGNETKRKPAASSHEGMVMDSGRTHNTAMGNTDMMPRMQAHMDSMQAMTPGQMSATMPRHEQMMSEMLDRMGGEMRQMQMAENSEWTALTDSVKQDLAELPSLSGEKLQTRMRAHAERVRRLLGAHEQMMKGM